MKEDEIEIGEVYFYVPSTSTNVRAINFIFVFEKRIFYDTVRYKICSSSGTYKECFINELCNTSEEAIDLVICNAHGKRKYNIEYEIKATQRILNKFQKEEKLRKEARLCFKLMDDCSCNKNIMDLLNKINKHKQFADRRKKLKG